MKKNIVNKKKLKEKLLNHIFYNGKKKTSEKILTKNFKCLQKSYKKSHNEIIKLAVVYSTPVFRTIKLKNKRRKKKSIKEIPAFFSTYMFRTSWALKYLTETSNKKSSNIFYEQLQNEMILSAQYLGDAVKFKNELQNQALKNKKYFKYYKW